MGRRGVRSSPADESEAIDSAFADRAGYADAQDFGLERRDAFQRSAKALGERPQVGLSSIYSSQPTVSSPRLTGIMEVASEKVNRGYHLDGKLPW